MYSFCTAANCNNKAEYKCPGCRILTCCSVECFKASWKEGHKAECVRTYLPSKAAPNSTPLAYANMPIKGTGTETGFYLRNGYRFDGHFLDGLPHGHCKETRPDGTTYTGMFKVGKYDGLGELADPNQGYTYEGCFQASDFHGQGKETFKDGTSDGSSYGTSDGSSYEGMFAHGVKHGKGRAVRFDGIVYEGDFVEGKGEGTGTVTWPDGYTYSGQFHDNESHGLGKSVCPDGTMYEGQWKDGRPEGQGKKTYGPLVPGMYCNQIFQKQCKKSHFVGIIRVDQVGLEVSVHAPGTTYEGGWKAEKEHGAGKLTFPDGTVLEGTWKEGVMAL